MLTIDEVQRAPGLVLALKAAVDETPRAGAFLLTGSADLFRLSGTEDSLVGRVENIELYGFSQGELERHRESFIDSLLSGKLFLGRTMNLTRADYLRRALQGTYPEAVARPQGRPRNQWIDSYIAQITRRDALEVADLRKADHLPRRQQTLTWPEDSWKGLSRANCAVRFPGLKNRCGCITIAIETEGK